MCGIQIEVNISLPLNKYVTEITITLKTNCIHEKYFSFKAVQFKERNSFIYVFKNYIY